MYNNDKALSNGFKVGAAVPLDDRLVYGTLQDLLDAITADPHLPLRFYSGMVISLTANESQYMWKPSADGLLPTSFVYPPGYQVGSVNYSSMAYNFKPIFVVIDQPFYANNLEIEADTAFPLSHGLDTTKIILYAWEDNEPVLIDYELVDNNTINLLSSENIIIDVKVTK
jgi:hypothetical protein